MSDNFDDLPVIDSHIHLFNLGFVPLRGILISRGVPPWLADYFAKLLENRLVTESDEDIQRLAPLNRSLTDKGAAKGTLADNLGTQDEALEELIISFAKTSPRATVADGATFKGMPKQMQSRLDSVPLPERIEQADLSPAERLLAQVATLVLRYITDFAEDAWLNFSWIMLLLNHESHLAKRFETTYAIQAQKGLAILHMMDMDNHYPVGDSTYAFITKQIPRTRALVQASGGSLLAFVAFDPFRNDSLKIIKQAISSKYAGIKFYPPSGYRPTDNEDKDTLHISAQVVNSRNDALYAYCVAEDIPLFTHCTPFGMEARRGITGKFSNPKHWRRVLQKHPNLRLCLGHAGGEAAWLTDQTPDGDADFINSYAYDVVDLCVTYPNVYCEFGHFHAILDGKHRPNFQRRLERVVMKHGKQITDKILYGSDWHMIERFPDHAEYLHVMRALFEGSDILRPHMKAFFVTNALRYLQLGRYITRNQSQLTNAELTYLKRLDNFTQPLQPTA